VRTQAQTSAQPALHRNEISRYLSIYRADGSTRSGIIVE
jgi:hypothetical protein